MNAGFSSLTALKAQLLNESLRADTGYDLLIKALGLGVAGKFAGFCNRAFGRVAGDTFITTGGRASLIVPRYPIETVTALDVRDTITAGWVNSLLTLDTYNPGSGCVYFSTPLDYAQIRVTYTGGYWWNTTEGDSETQVIGYDRRAATVAIASGAKVVAVVFATPLAVAPTSISPTMLKPSAASANVQVLGVRADSITTAGFTVDLAAAVPTAGYQLSYEASAPVSTQAEVDAGTQPEGSTELPEDIRSAWFLQCQHIWRASDVLGISIGKQEEDNRLIKGLAAMDLIPLVQSMLKDHVRFALT